MKDELETLRNRPSSEKIETILRSNLKTNQSNAHSLKLVTLLVNYTIPEAYTLLPVSTQTLLVESLQNVIGIGNLTSKLGLVKSNRELVQIYLQVLSKVFSPELIVKLVSDKNPLILNEIDKLVFKGKTYGAVNEVLETSQFNVAIPFNNYNEYLADSILRLFDSGFELKLINKFIMSVVSVDSQSAMSFLTVMFTKKNFRYFTSSFMTMSRLERKRMVQLFVHFLNKRVKDINREEILAYFNLAQFASESIDLSIVEQIIRSLNLELNIIFCLLVSFSASSTKIVHQLMSTWSDEHLMKSESLVIQESRTHFLVHLLSQCNSTFIGTLMTNQDFLTAVSNRLQSLSNNSRSLGILLANQVCKLAKKDLIFKDHDNSFEHLLGEKIDLESIEVDKCWEIVQTKSVVIVKPVEISLNKLTILPDSEDDSDDDDDDPTIVSQDKLEKPIYIKQLLEYLTVDPKVPGSYEKTKLALAHGSTLIRQKFTQEVSFYADDLLENLVALSTQNQRQNENRLEMMISVLVKNPNSVTHLYKLLLTGDYSLQQRMILLTSVSLSIRELRGFKDGLVKFEEHDFQTSKLPANLHNLYFSIQDTMMDKIKSSQGQVVRKSSKLLKDEVVPHKPIVAGFYKSIVNNKFYFPLINLWYESGGSQIDIGHYTPVFLAQYLSTLNLILHCAYPSASNLRDMIQEHLLITSAILKFTSSEQLQVIESVVTGVMIVCDISPVQEGYIEPLQFVQSWLVQNWEGIIDDKLKSLCAGLLLKLNDLEANLFESI